MEKRIGSHLLLEIVSKRDQLSASILLRVRVSSFLRTQLKRETAKTGLG